jgi:hypothetical protein
MQIPAAKPEQACCPIVEFRQYTLHPGMQHLLIDLFDREFIEPQEALGMKIIGQFRDVDCRNRFVWLRGFHDMRSRARALQEFYGGPVWKAHRDAANATMIDSDNVLLLHPASAAAGFSLENKEGPAPGSNQVLKELIVATICYFDAPVSAGFVEFFKQTLRPLITDAGASVVAYLASENSENSFPALPVREGENVFVWFLNFNDPASFELHFAALARSQRWCGEISEELAGRLKQAPEILKLSPTARSLL